VNEFDALNMANYIDANDPLTDPRTAGYAEGYLKPNRITSMLDAVIRVSGQNLGVLCFEHVDCPHHWETDEIAFACQLADLIAITLLNRDRMRAEVSLRESEEKYRVIFNNEIYAILIFNLDTQKLLDVNDAFTQMYGYTREELLSGMTIHDITVEHEASDSATEKIRKEGSLFIPLRYHKKKDGTIFPVEIVGGPYEWKGKQVMFALLHDITQRKQSEQTIQHALAEKEVLLREIHHRVKNNLAGIIALIELQSRSLTDPDQIYLFKDLETRIRSMALVHESLYQTKDIAHIRLTTYTENLTRYLFQVYETATNVQCRIDMGEITMPIETATPCGLVMTEIVTNSLKYAFPKTFSCEEIRGEPCTIAVTLHREGSDYLLGVSDNGIGIPEGTDATMSHSLGLFLIRFIVEHQLDGGIGISTARGTAYTIRFPEPAVKEGNAYEKM
jgi:PAS domain S-box-containing protein